MEKLTLKDAMLYPNAKVVSYLNEVAGQDNQKFEDLHSWIMFYSRMFSNLHTVVADCKLKLRPLSDLTEVEKRITDSLDRNISMTEILYSGKGLLTDGSRDMVDYLRSINIDIDGFIEAGKAVAE